MKTVFSMVLLAALFACGTTKVKGNGSNQTITIKKPEKVKDAILSDTFDPKESNSSTSVITIDTAFINENIITLKVRYYGGCAESSFELIGSKAISKSLPPIRSIELIHSGSKDACEAIIIKTLQFNLQELAYQKEEGSQIKLNLKGYKPQLMYTYTTQ